MDKATINPESATPFPLAKDTLDLILSPQQELHSALAAALTALYGGWSVIIDGCENPGAAGWIYHNRELWRVEAAVEPDALAAAGNAWLIPRTTDIRPLADGEPVMQRRRMEWVGTEADSYYTDGSGLMYSGLRRAGARSLSTPQDLPHREGHLHLQKLEREGVVCNDQYAFAAIEGAAPLTLTREAGIVRIGGKLQYTPRVQATQSDIDGGYTSDFAGPFLFLRNQTQLNNVREGLSFAIQNGQQQEVRTLGHYDGLWIEIDMMFAPAADLAVSVWSETRGEPLPAAIHTDDEGCRLICPTQLEWHEVITLNIAYRP